MASNAEHPQLDLSNYKDLDPAAFLQSISELKDRRDREDNERVRKLEEDIEKSRQQRAARRAERERSLSPEKPLTSRTPTPGQSRPSVASSNPDAFSPSIGIAASDTSATAETHRGSRPLQSDMAPSTGDDSRGAVVEEIPEFKGFGSLKKKENPVTQTGAATTTDPPTSPSTQSATSLARSGTLSWQQRRPGSRAGLASRPSSALGADSPARAHSPEKSELSRDQIAASLGSRDPNWFRQTADRGLGSAAYRKSREEPGAVGSVVSGRRGLPGMSREASLGQTREASPTPESVTSDSISQVGSTRGSLVSNRFSANTSISAGSKEDGRPQTMSRTPYVSAPPSEGTTAPDGEDAISGRTLAMSTSQARLNSAAERPASPTKAMGSFVQSAMMKRSDSASKRLSRQNTLTSQTSSLGGLQGSHSMPRLEPSSGTDAIASARPASSSSSNLASLTQDMERSSDSFVKPTVPRHHSRTNTAASNYSATGDETAISSPGSPGKRFSPVKSSWIESALGKTETPKTPSPSKSSQPDWMANIAKAKAQRQSQDVTPRPNPEAEDMPHRPNSPVKSTPFGQSLLRRANSRDPKSESTTPHPSSPPPVAQKPISMAEKPSTQAGMRLASKPITGETRTQATTNVARQLDGEKTKPSPESRDPKLRVGESENDVAPEISVPSPVAPQPRSPLTKPKSIDAGKPDLPPENNLRGTPRSRPPTAVNHSEEPEFKSVFGTLRKTRTEKYVAPDTLGNNIRGGKAALNITGGPQKTVRRDEFKESILAKKEDFKAQAEQSGPMQKRINATGPALPQKPEALLRREGLARNEPTKLPRKEVGEDNAPEALRHHKSLRSKTDIVAPGGKKPKGSGEIGEPLVNASEPLEKSISAPESIPAPDLAHKSRSPPATETSKLAARFNPGLAGILARGPLMSSEPPSRTNSPAGVVMSTISDSPRPSTETGPLQDMRKGRAKGPKRRGGGNSAAISTGTTSNDMVSHTDMSTSMEARPPTGSKPPSGEKASPALQHKPQELDRIGKPTLATPRKNDLAAAVASVASRSQPVSPSKSPALLPRPTATSSFAEDLKLGLSGSAPPGQPTMPAAPDTSNKSPEATSKAKLGYTANTISTLPVSKDPIPEFKGFGSPARTSASSADDDKENKSNSLPSVRSMTSKWGKQSSSRASAPPSQIKLPTRKDEETAMRTAGLQALPSPIPGHLGSDTSGLGITPDNTNAKGPTPSAGATSPPKPAKSSRVVSGHLSLGSPNNDDERGIPHVSETKIERRLHAAFGVVPRSGSTLTIITQDVLNNVPSAASPSRVTRRQVFEVSHDNVQKLTQQRDYTLFEEHVYVVTSASVNATGNKSSQTFVWTSKSSSQADVDKAQGFARKVAKENTSSMPQLVEHGHEPATFLDALGGILVTRRTTREGATKQYMLCGRKHIGHIVFDEVDFDAGSLSSGYVYLVSYPVTLTEAKFYLWKGNACSAEEVSAARLAAMDQSETGEIIEVDEGAEFSSFIKVFGSDGTRSIPREPCKMWQQKAMAPNKFRTRLFRIETVQQTTLGIITGMFARKQSWQSSGTRSPTRSDHAGVKVEAKEISPFTQSDLEVEGIYVLDAYSEVYVLLGPLLPSQSEPARTTVLSQAVLFASDYAMLASSVEDRPSVPKAWFVFAGVPQHVKMLFRHWDESRGLWGTGELMVGWSAGSRNELDVVPLDEVLSVVCRQ